jgi:hypothetical protein
MRDTGDSDHESRAGVRAERGGRDQGGDDRSGDYRDRVAAGGSGDDIQSGTMLGLLVMIVLTSLAFNSMMFLLMVRIEDPLVPRAMFGILNTLLFFPSGSIYPVEAFPAWLRRLPRWIRLPMRCMDSSRCC